MGRNETTRGESTRREFVTYGGTAVGGGLLAGCSDLAGQNDSESTAETSEGSYSVTMSPMGTVEFDSVPESVYTGLPNTADMAIAAGRADAINAVYHPEYHGRLMNNFYERLDGVSFDWEGLINSWNMGREGFYELDSDVHLTDPAYASTLENLDADDVAKIREQVAPWFGNYYSDRQRDPPESWADDYQYYNLWEIFGRVAEVFQAGDRADALAEIHASMRSRIEENLPAASERPSVALTFPGENDSFWIYRLNADGFLAAHTRPLGATDAFAGVEFEGAQKQVDYEGMLEADPDVILVLFTMASSYEISTVRDELESDAVASEISAVNSDSVYAQGARYQGPIMNLFQIEMTPKQLYPEQFGEWPGYVDGEPYPEIPDDEQLFDRQEVSDSINGKPTNE